MERYETVKTMTCEQLGGACDEAFAAESFEKIAEMSKAHAMQIFQQRNYAHLLAAEKMKNLIPDPYAMKNWLESRRKEFSTPLLFKRRQEHKLVAQVGLARVKLNPWYVFCLVGRIRTTRA